MTHVVLVGPYPMPGVRIQGGVERVIDTFLTQLPPNVKVTLMVPGSAQDLRTDKDGVSIIYLRKSRFPATLAYWSIDSLRLWREIRRVRPDSVHVQGSAGYGLLWPHPFFVTVHGIPQLDSAYFNASRFGRNLVRAARAKLISLVERMARHRAGRIVVINPYVAQALPCIASARTRFIPNPVNPAMLTYASPGAKENCRLLVVGKVCSRKNTLGILQLFSAIAHQSPEARLAICGATTDRAYFESCVAFAKAAGIADRIEWLGNLGLDALVEQYDMAHLMLMASAQETAPMAVAEAHVRGLPVAAPPEFGLKFMIEDGVNGVWLHDSDAAIQASQIIGALQKRFDREAIARAARGRYDPGVVVNETLAFYEAAK